MAIDIVPEQAAISFEENSTLVKSVIADMVAFANEVTCSTEAGYKKITSLYSQAREWKKTIETKRKALIEPFRKQQSAINDMAKELTDPLDQVITIANLKATNYQAQLNKLKEEEAEQLRAAAALFDAEEALYIPPMAKVLRGDGAMAITKTEKVFRVVDIEKVPAKYLMVNEALVKQDLKLGINEIPGIEITLEQKTTLRTR